MLVPIQYQRIMAVPDVDGFDLSSFAFKSSTSAPFSAELKVNVVKRWPGLLLKVHDMIVHGSDDTFTSSADSTIVFDRMRSSDKTLEAIESGRHELLNDLPAEDIMQMILGWLDARS